MNNDIYWSHVCMSSMKSRNEKTFEYGLHHIINSSRKQTLRQIYDQFMNNDSKIIEVVNKYHSPIPVVVA